MISEGKILAGRSGGQNITLDPRMANRHGLVAGATGTGKTTTVKVLAEGFSQLGVPVFISDVKGDLGSLARKHAGDEKARLEALGISGYEPDAFLVRFWDVYGESGIPVRAKVSDMGPLLLGQALRLSDSQKGILQIVFRVADELGWELIDFKDLNAMISFVRDHRSEISEKYGNVAPQSLSALQRSLLVLEDQGADRFFGEPDLNMADWFAAHDGKGVINILKSRKLSENPLLYSTFLLWMLSALYDQLPERGDTDKPVFAMFFDEAHILFENADKTVIERLRQIVRLIRSKGVGIYFITQSPKDIDEDVLSQLQNRFQHALHAYTPKEQQALKAVANSFRPNEKFDTLKTLGELRIGEALVSVLDEKGVVQPVERTVIVPCQSAFESLDAGEEKRLVSTDPLYAEYADPIDRQSAWERYEKEKGSAKKEKRPAADPIKKAARSATRTIGRETGKAIVRSVMGNRSKASKAASSFAGSLLSDVFGSIFK